MPFSKLKKISPLSVLVILALLVRVVWFFYISGISQNNFFYVDSLGYQQLAENILNGNPYSLSGEPPFYPDVFRTPVLPLILVLCNANIEAFILLQIFLSVLTVIITHRLALRISGHKKIAFMAGLLVAIDVPSVVFANMIMTETLYTLFLLAAVYQLFIWKETSNRKHLLFSSVFFGLTALTRPIGIFFPLFVLPLLWLINRKKNVPVIKGNIQFLLPFGILSGSWIVRNYLVFGSFFFSHIGTLNLAFFSAGTIRSETQQLHINVARTQLYEEAAENMSTTPYDDPAAFYVNLRNVCIKEMMSHPRLFLANAAKANFRLFFYPMSGFVNQVQTGMNPHLAWDVKELYPVTKTLVVFQLIFIIFYSTGILLCFILFFRKEFNGFLLFILTWILLYFSLTGFGPEMEARFRIPAMPYIAILAACGWILFFQSTLFKKSTEK